MSGLDFSVFLQSLSVYSYTEAFDRWQAFLDVKQQDQPEKYSLYLDRFLERYPFSFLHWTKYLALRIEDLGKAYNIALQHMPKCLSLWRLYLDYIRDLGNAIIYKKELDRAIIEIGADTNAAPIFEEYLSLINDDVSKWEFFKKVFSRSLVNLEHFFGVFQGWIDSLSNEKLQLIYTKETRGVTYSSMSPEYLKGEMEKQYKKAIEWREKRLEVEAKITQQYFNGEDTERKQQYSVWRQYIALMRKQGVVENICYCYEKALMSQTEHTELWQEVFHYLENETGKYMRVLSLLRYNGPFFIHFSTQLYYYWCDLEERENCKTARFMYTQLEEMHKLEPSSAKHLQTYLRHIQLQIRQKEWTTAKNLYDTLLVIYQSDLELLSYILIEYANFVVKRYKDTEYPKKLLHAYFQALPYNQYLFTNYLQFMRNFENKDGYYDELMSVVATGLAKAKKITVGDEYRRVVGLIKNCLRASLTSIYLIKMSEKKMLDIEERMKHEQQTSDQS